MKSLESKIAKREGKKVQVSIGNIREVLRVMTDLMAEEAARSSKKYGVSGARSPILASIARTAEKKMHAILKKEKK